MLAEIFLARLRALLHAPIPSDSQGTRRDPRFVPIPPPRP
jgi:hypothetical protein